MQFALHFYLGSSRSRADYCSGMGQLCDLSSERVFCAHHPAGVMPRGGDKQICFYKEKKIDERCFLIGRDTSSSMYPPCVILSVWLLCV